MRLTLVVAVCGVAGSWLAPPALLVPAPLRPSRCAPPRAKESSLERLQREAREKKQRQRTTDTGEQQDREVARRERREARQASFASQKSEFANVCQAQFSIALPGLKVSRAAVYMRREDPATGMLEFFPVAVWPETQDVWVVGDNQPASIPDFAMLPGGTPAETLLPSYPFLQSTGGEGGGPTRSYLATTLADAGLSMPLVYNGVVLGVLAVWCDASAERAEWSDGQRHVLEQVARTLAIAAVLEQQAESRGGGAAAGSGRGSASSRGARGSAAAAAAAVDGDGAFGGFGSEFGDSDEGLASEQADVVLREVQRMLHMSVHQLSSPLSAVRTLSKLLLRRLDDDSLSREVAKDILLQSERLEELLHPVSRLASQLPVATTPAPSSAAAGGADGAAAADDDDGDGGDSVPLAAMPPATEPLAPPAVPPAAPSGAPLQTYAYDEDVPSWWTAGAPPPVPSGRPAGRAALCFPDDVLRPVASLTEGLAREAGVAFAASIDPELPGTRVPQAALREAISNLIDNALKYCEPVDGTLRVGGRREMGLCCRWDEERQRILICVWNSAPPLSDAELDAAFEWGERGQAALRKEGVGGSGYGLHIVQQLVALMGGEVELRNAPRPAWLREALLGGDGDGAEGDGEAPSGVSSCVSLPRTV